MSGCYRFSTGTRRTSRARTTSATRIPVFSQLRRSSITTSSTTTRRLLWVLPSVTSVRSLKSTKQRRWLTFCGITQTGEIKALAGVDFLTISPNLLEELKNDTVAVPKKLDAQAARTSSNKYDKVSYIDNEPEFRWALLQDQMAFDKLHEGIKKFAEDGETLKGLLRKKLSA